MKLERIHHVAYRCHDAKETVEFYQKHLNMDFVLAISEDKVPSTKKPDPYIHVFLDAGNGNILAFFEITNSPPMAKDPNTPDWVQHIAFELDSMETLLAAKKNLEEADIEVIGVTDHTLFQSIYFFDPNGHRLELTTNTATPEMRQRLDAVKWKILDEWSQHKKVVSHADWLHKSELSDL